MKYTITTSQLIGDKPYIVEQDYAVLISTYSVFVHRIMYLESDTKGVSSLELGDMILRHNHEVK